MSETKRVSDMSKEELERYHHTPETELSVLVCRASEKEEFADLKDYLQMMSEKHPKKIHAKDTAGMTALHCAVACSSLPCVILLLKYGSAVDSEDLLGFTPLFLATGRYPNTDIASHLIKEGRASISATTKTGATSLHGAALVGNTACVQLLLKHGADPRTGDNEGTTAFDLAKNDDIRTILHDAIIEWDSQKDTKDMVCSQCKKAPKDSKLMRCSQCHITLYCSKDCQKKHWHQGGHNESCDGYVIARPMDQNVYQTSFYHVMGSQKKNVKVFTKQGGEAPTCMGFLKNKRFVVKVQVPIGGQSGNMMVYNADRTCEGFIFNSEKGYQKLASKIRQEGMMGIKAFFWAELMNEKEGVFKVFHGKTAPFQTW